MTGFSFELERFNGNWIPAEAECLRKKREGIDLNKWVFELNCSSDIARTRRENRGRGTTGGRTRNTDFFWIINMKSVIRVFKDCVFWRE
jgi:hypothetical protein